MPKSYFKSADWDKDVPQQDSVLVQNKGNKLKTKSEKDSKLHKMNNDSKPVFKSAKREKSSKKVNKLSHEKVTEKNLQNSNNRNVLNGWNIESVIENVENKLSMKKDNKKKRIHQNSKTSQEKISLPMLNLDGKKSKKNKKKNISEKANLVEVSSVDPPLNRNTKVVEEQFVGSSRKDKTAIILNKEKKVKAKKVIPANDVLLPKTNKKSPDLSLIKKATSKKEPVSINYVTAPKIKNIEPNESTFNIETPSYKLEKLKVKRKRKKNKVLQSTVNTTPAQKRSLETNDETIEKATKLAKVENKNKRRLETQKNERNQVKLRKQEILKKILEDNPGPEAVNDEVKLERGSFRNRHLQSSLRKRMMEKLKAAQFRFLNEKLYLSEGKDAKELFQTDPDSYSIYHEGFRQQMKKWPINPLDIIIKQISEMSKDTKVADLGCGDGVLAKSVPQKVRSFDLVSSDPLVEACDMAHTPLLAGEVNVVVFCLALMGTNMNDYLIEANRVLKIGGIMKIAEVESRFQDVEQFIQAVEKFGFSLKKKDLSHNIFYFMDFKKHREVGQRNKLPYLKLKPCLYKKR